MVALNEMSFIGIKQFEFVQGINSLAQETLNVKKLRCLILDLISFLVSNVPRKTIKDLILNTFLKENFTFFNFRLLLLLFISKYINCSEALPLYIFGLFVHNRFQNELLGMFLD